MSVSCEIYPRPDLSSDECKLLGDQLSRWLYAGTGTRALVQFGVDDLTRGELPQQFFVQRLMGIEGRGVPDAQARFNLPPGERVNFVSTARSIVRRKSTGDDITNPVGVFTACVRKRLWNASGEDEDWARAAIREIDCRATAPPDVVIPAIAEAARGLSVQPNGDDDRQALENEIRSMPVRERLQLAEAAIRRAPQFEAPIRDGKANRFLHDLMVRELRERNSVSPTSPDTS